MDTNDIRITFRATRPFAARLDRLAAHAGCRRSEFLRAAVDLADAHMVVQQVAMRDAERRATEEEVQSKRRAEVRVVEITQALKPKTIL